MFEDASGLPHAFDRSAAHPEHSRVVFREGQRYFTQGAELNELQSIIAGRGRRVANMVARDGDRRSGANIIVVKASGTLTLEAGDIYARGDVRAVAAASFTGVNLTGDLVVGVRIHSQAVTEVEQPHLLGLEPGTRGEGEPGAARVIETISWGHSRDGAAGDLYAVYLLQDGDVIDQTPPPNLSGVQQVIAMYDSDVAGNYIVRGCEVSTLGIAAGAQQFSIAAGVANIRGFKRTRTSDLRHAEPEAWDTATVTAESHTITGSPCTITLNHTPLAAVTALVVEKEVTAENVTKGVTNSLDSLGNTSVRQILEVKQGGTTYVAGADYQRTGDKVDWSLGGAEPASGSSYTVKYRYNAAAAPTATTNTSVTFTGGVTGGEVQVSYAYKLPRIDILCLDADGRPVYIKGIASDKNPQPPFAPSACLKLAEISNSWAATPTVTNNGTRRLTQDDLVHMMEEVVNLFNLTGIERLNRDVDSREATAKKGLFADPMQDDELRDAGVSQTASVADGILSLSIDASVIDLVNGIPIMLDYTTEVAIAQELATQCYKVNPYQVVDPLPVGLAIDPRSDFWTVHSTTWLSPVTRVFTGDVTARTRTEVVKRSTQRLPTLRQRSIAFTITGFGAGEVMTALTFDGLDVKPAGVIAASGAGVVAGSFTIPAGVAAGVKEVRAVSASGRIARAEFRGQGTLEIETLRRVTTVTIQPPKEPHRSTDPQAQTFALTGDGFIAAVDLIFCSKGDAAKPCYVAIVSTDNNYPATETWGIGRVDMSTVVLNQWTTVTLECPVFLERDRKYAFVAMTDDADHAIKGAKLGDFDAAAQRYVASNPYTIGDRFSASAGLAWLVHPDSDLTFRLRQAVFAPLTKTVTLGVYAVTNASDLMVMAGVVIPTAAASLVFYLELADGRSATLQPGQNWELTSFYTGNVTVKAMLAGSAEVTPILLPGAQLFVGTLRTTGTYVSRAFNFTTATVLYAWMKCQLPAGATLTVEYDKADGNWIAVPASATEALNDGWVDTEFRKTWVTLCTTVRLVLTLTGTPAARPYISDLRAKSY